LPEFFVPERARGINTTAQLNLKSDPVDHWTLIIENQHCEVKHESAVQPQLVLTAAPMDLMAVLSGKLDATRAYMLGKIRLDGKITQAIKLMGLFDIPDEIRGKIRL